MLGKKIQKLAKKVKKGVSGVDSDPGNYKSMKEYQKENDQYPKAPGNGFFALYVGKERERYVVPTGYLSHPLFKMLLEKAYKEFGFEQTSGLVVPCSVSAFQEVVSYVECNNGKFDMGKIFHELVESS